ncbi:23S rRNA (guanosine(2251)-2'-O)-methyltransferase RlmB [Legionella sp. W05-934-2]|jgi:23S rRNA (guanosine2251-2'-O)-methyltransferase|uniref:23S rRNA (guanosine(2251)-2'-O)-methyltransferase RlmB n=1 Tax=Legionella sp. W05-934-2 TaxID=1198649 RepID=UPI003462A296
MTNQQWVFGVHAVTAVLSQTNRQVYTLYIDTHKTDQAYQKIRQFAEQQSIAIRSIQAIEKQFSNQTHQGVIASVAPLPEYQQGDLPLLLGNTANKNALILILDGITDVHNLGACLRTADGAGVDFVIMPKDKSAPINATVSKVASGAAECVPIVRVTNLARAMKALQEAGVWIYGAAGEAKQTLYQLDCQGPVALVMGSEGNGLRRLTREHCDQLYSLPMQGYVESLNVSVATGVSLYEVLRQRMNIPSLVKS